MGAALHLSAILPPTLSRVDADRVSRPRTRRALAKERTRQKLIDAARFLFVNLGYEATTMRDLADRMAMSTGAIFAQVPDKATLWTEVMGSPPPTLAVAEEIALIQALRPGWVWVLRTLGGEHVASLSTPDYVPMTSGDHHTGRAASPAEALRQARLAAERADGRGAA